MKKTIIILGAVAFLVSCGGKKENKTEPTATLPNTVENKTPATDPPATPPDVTASNLTYDADGVSVSNSTSILVTKDKTNLQPGAPYMCMLMSNAAKHDNEYLTVNFLFDTKPGTYPIVGASFQRGQSPNSQMFGGILGGNPKLTRYKLTLTECKDLGSNNMGGHKWSISGNWDEIVIEAPKIMLMDETKKHPKEVKLGKGTFTNLTFDDNGEQIAADAMKKMQKK